MKEILRLLSHDNLARFQVWSYLWVNRDNKNVVKFTLNDLCYIFKLPKTTIQRHLSYMNDMNMDKIHVESLQTRRGTELKFYEKGKPSKAPKNPLHEDSFKYVQKFYIDSGFDYPNIRDHKRFIVNILTKLEGSIKLKSGVEPTPEVTKEALEALMTNLPKWWVDNGNITLPTINKSYAKIIQQIKNNAGSTDSYTKESQSTSAEDYEKFVQ